MRTIITILALALVACAAPETDEDALRAEIRSEIEAEAESAHSAVEDVVEEEEDDPPPVQAESNTGDYSSRQDYIDEVIDSADKVSSLLESVADSAMMTANGDISSSDFARLMTKARETLASHIDFFEDRTPPQDFARSQEAFLRAWRLFDDAFVAGQRCGEFMDIDACEESADLMTQGTAVMGEATSLLPHS